MVALMKKHGVDVSKVRFVNIGASGDVFRAATMGTIDAGTGEVAVIEQADVYKVRLVEHGNMSIELPEYTYQGAWASDVAIKNKREVIVKALAAYAQLYRFVHKPEALDAFLKARKAVFPNGTEADGMANWHYLQTYKPFAGDLVLNDQRMRYMQQLNVDLDVQSKVLPFEQVADMSLAQEAIKLL
jgi:NitT/TauT family transport system substrate-binding protein